MAERAGLTPKGRLMLRPATMAEFLEAEAAWLAESTSMFPDQLRTHSELEQLYEEVHRSVLIGSGNKVDEAIQVCFDIVHASLFIVTLNIMRHHYAEAGMTARIAHEATMQAVLLHLNKLPLDLLFSGGSKKDQLLRNIRREGNPKYFPDMKATYDWISQLAKYAHAGPEMTELRIFHLDEIHIRAFFDVLSDDQVGELLRVNMLVFAEFLDGFHRVGAERGNDFSKVIPKVLAFITDRKNEIPAFSAAPSRA